MFSTEYQSGQGLVDYALVIILVAILVIAILVFFGPEIIQLFSNVVANI
jgi:pilus assembly protein Flp/PilA